MESSNEAWGWRKKPVAEMATDVAAAAEERSSLGLKLSVEEVNPELKNEIVAVDRESHCQRELQFVNEKLLAAESECRAKDDLVRKHMRLAQEAIAGWEKAESEARSVKDALDIALKRCALSEERSGHLDGALKECMKQLRFVREQQDRRVHDVLLTTTTEFEKARMCLEEKLAETNNRMTRLRVENSSLNEALVLKEKMIREISELRTRAEADSNIQMKRVEMTEKENASLKYEAHVLQKELALRNEEREFNRRIADVFHKQHLECVKKLAKLEAECQRLRVMVRKRSPSPVGMAKMKDAIVILEREPDVDKRNKGTGSLVEYSPDTTSPQISSFVNELHTLKEENGNLKETANNKANELQLSRVMYVRAVSRLSQVEKLLEEFSKVKKAEEVPNNCLPIQEQSMSVTSDIGSDDKFSYAESWASGLISEQGQFGKRTNTVPVRTGCPSDMNLMDDFLEMEKFAVTCADTQTHVSEEVVKAISGPLDTESCGQVSEMSGQETVHISESLTNADTLSFAKSSQLMGTNISDSICKMIELLEGINFQSPKHGNSESLNLKDNGYLRGKGSEIDKGYMIRVFQWKTSELSDIVYQFIRTCGDLLNGKADLEKFFISLSSAFDWIMNHCFSIQDVSSMRDEIKNHLGWDDSRSECETEVGSTNHFVEANKFWFSRDQVSPKFTSFNGHNVLYEDSPREGNQRLKYELLNVELTKKDLETKLQEAIDQRDNLLYQNQTSETTIVSLKKQLETLKESKRMAEDQTEKLMFANEELHSQLTEAKVDLNEVSQRIVSLEVEMGNKSAYCEELEASCVELQLQLQSLVKKELPCNAMNRESQLQQEREITIASEKLAKCQQTILSLGRQMQAMSSPRESPLFDKVMIPTPSDTTTPAANPAALITPIRKTLHRQRTSLLEKMVDEDNAHANAFSSPKTKEMVIIENGRKPVELTTSSINSVCAITEPIEKYSKEVVHQEHESAGNALAIVQSKRRGGWSLWRRLFRKRRGISRKMSLSNVSNS